jgi:formylglycine-generating enzyme required for sulfatase activity
LQEAESAFLEAFKRLAMGGRTFEEVATAVDGLSFLPPTALPYLHKAREVASRLRVSVTLVASLDRVFDRIDQRSLDAPPVVPTLATAQIQAMVPAPTALTRSAPPTPKAPKVEEASVAGWQDPVRPLRRRRPTRTVEETSVAGWQGSTAGELKVVPVQDQDVRFRWCPPGSFMMGGNDWGWKESNNEDHQVDVTLTRGFWMMETEVTRGLSQAVMRTTPSWSREYGVRPSLPVYGVSYSQAEAFGATLTGLLRDDKQLPSGLSVVLPTEAQWEYAARAGTTTWFAFDFCFAVSEYLTLGRYAWHRGNSGNKPHEVKTRTSNPWNLHDMFGNVAEWCSDWYADKLPGGVDPRGPGRGSLRVVRGGSWAEHARYCNPAYRTGMASHCGFNYMGFRVAVVQE